MNPSSVIKLVDFIAHINSSGGFSNNYISSNEFSNNGLNIESSDTGKGRTVEKTRARLVCPSAEHCGLFQCKLWLQSIFDHRSVPQLVCVAGTEWDASSCCIGVGSPEAEEGAIVQVEMVRVNVQ